MDRLTVATVDVWRNAPIGAYGFRSGMWQAVLSDGTKTKIFCSVPHAATIAQQYDMVMASARKKIEA